MAHDPHGWLAGAPKEAQYKARAQPRPRGRLGAAPVSGWRWYAMPDGLCGQLDALLCLPVALLAVAAVVRRSRRRVCRMCRATTDRDRRAWRFCRSCGAPRNESDKAGANPPGTKAVTAPPLAGGPILVLPSELLRRRGWCREAALDASGYEVFPTDETAAKWSVWGACDKAFEPHTRLWRAWRKGLDDILAERYGGASPHVWNRHPARRYATVVAVAEEVERRIGIARHDNDSATKAATGR